MRLPLLLEGGVADTEGDFRDDNAGQAEVGEGCGVAGDDSLGLLGRAFYQNL